MSSKSFDDIVDVLSLAQLRRVRTTMAKHGLDVSGLTGKTKAGLAAQIKAARKKGRDNKKKIIMSAIVVAVILAVVGITIFLTKNPALAAKLGAQIKAAGPAMGTVMKRGGFKVFKGFGAGIRSVGSQFFSALQGMAISAAAAKTIESAMKSMESEPNPEFEEYVEAKKSRAKKKTSVKRKKATGPKKTIKKR